MNIQREYSDRISALPQDTIEKILTLMPIRDALRTSVLSKKWRHCWASIPKLVFDDDLVVLFFSDNNEFDKYKLVSAIFHVLLLHKGPILEFIICITIIDTQIFNEFDQMILYLSRSDNLKKFIFESWSSECRYKLPSFFFSLDGLEVMHLMNCVFEPPLLFNGFRLLRSLKFQNVDITAKTFQRFLSNCPLLEEFTLIGKQTNLDFTGGNECTFVELFKCLPSVQVLEMSRFYIEQFAASDMPLKLPTSLVHLRIIVLDVCFHELSFALCVINSSPNLEKIKVQMLRGHSRCAQQAFKNVFDLQDYSGLKLNYLKEVEIRRCNISAHEMAFVKLIMAKSPVLKKARIELDTHVSVDEEVQMFRDLLLLQFPRASPLAKFIIERPKKLVVSVN